MASRLARRADALLNVLPMKNICAGVWGMAWDGSVLLEVQWRRVGELVGYNCRGWRGDWH